MVGVLYHVALGGGSSDDNAVGLATLQVLDGAERLSGLTGGAVPIATNS